MQHQDVEAPCLACPAAQETHKNAFGITQKETARMPPLHIEDNELGHHNHH
jgi:hypothetical protein